MMDIELSGDEVADAIADGVRKAFADALSGLDLAGVIAEGVRLALDQVWPSQILAAITDGTRQALGGGE